MSVPVALVKLNPQTIFLVSDDENHQVLHINKESVSYDVISEIHNIGSISETKRFPGKSLML